MNVYFIERVRSMRRRISIRDNTDEKEKINGWVEKLLGNVNVKYVSLI